MTGPRRSSLINGQGPDEVTFKEFREEWLHEFAEGDLSPFAKGQRFAIKLVTQWLGRNPTTMTDMVIVRWDR